MTPNEKINQTREELNSMAYRCRDMAQDLEELAENLENLPEAGTAVDSAPAPIHGFITIKRMLRNGLRPVLGQLVTVTLEDGKETTWRVIETEKIPTWRRTDTQPVVLQLATILHYRPFSLPDKKNPFGCNRYEISDLAEWLDSDLAEKLNVDDFGSITPRRELGGEDGRRLWLLSVGEAGFTEPENSFEWYACEDEEERAKRRQLKDSDGDPARWWLRTPYSGYARNVRLVYTDGSLYNYYAFGAYGVAPACIIM